MTTPYAQEIAANLARAEESVQAAQVLMAAGYGEQHLLSLRRNLRPVKPIYWSLLMRHEHAARALIELLQIGKTSPSVDPVLQHAPEAFNGIEVVAATGWQ